MLLCPLMWYGNRPRRRHGLGAVLHHVPQHLPGRDGPAARRHPADPEEPRPASSGPGRRAEAPRGRQLASRSRTAAAVGVVLDNGQELDGRRILSSAGLVRNAAAVRRTGEPAADRAPGQLSFVESMSVARPAAEVARLRPDDRVFQRLASSSTGDKPESELCDVRTRRDLLAQQFCLRSRRGRAGRQPDPHHGPGQLRPLAGAGRGRRTGWKSSAGTTGWPRRPCGSCPISAAA